MKRKLLRKMEPKNRIRKREQMRKTGTGNGSEKLEHKWMWEGKWDGKKRQLSFKIIVKITEVGSGFEKGKLETEVRNVRGKWKRKHKPKTGAKMELGMNGVGWSDKRALKFFKFISDIITLKLKRRRNLIDCNFKI